ncbi:hypothetical protein [Actinoplanes sp. OR16]|uniref:hypothetical protein n=1 Tax=Actinoplanes sp. OR16 TaxID=946334 RepID=UPI000FDA5D63|nr:hypothetical protein [Actinoplanes sp. OR16]
MNRSPNLALVLDQIELDMPGVQPLSTRERLQLWLGDQEEDTPEVIAALMILEDDSSREWRVQLYFDVEAARRPFESEDGWLIPGGDEAWWLYEEAERTYLHGLFVASLLCAHAACERALAGSLLDFASQLDPRWQRWGLTPLAEAAARFQIIAPDLEAKLKDLAERRKVTAHYKPPLHPNSVLSRALPPPQPPEVLMPKAEGRPLEHKDIDQAYREEAMRNFDHAVRAQVKRIADVMREDARFGMQTVIELLGGQHGHSLIGRI